MDCKTLSVFLGLFLGYLVYRFLNKNWPWIWATGIWLIRAVFILIIIALLAVAGPSGEELIPAVMWGVIEFLASQVKPKKQQSTYEE